MRVQCCVLVARMERHVAKIFTEPGALPVFAGTTHHVGHQSDWHTPRLFVLRLTFLSPAAGWRASC